MFYRKIELCIVRMGDNDMRTACTLEQEMVDHVILKTSDQRSYSLQLRYHWTEDPSSSLLIPRSNVGSQPASQR